MQRQLRHLPGQVHADLPGQHGVAVAPPGLQLTGFDLEKAADALGDAPHRQVAGLGLLAELGGHRGHVERLALELGQGLQSGDGPFHLPAAGQVLG